MTQPTGYILPKDRTQQQRAFDAAYHAAAGTFATRSAGFLDALPARALLVELESKLIGKPAFRVWQQTGSCVAAAFANAAAKAMVGDIVIDERDPGGRIMPYPWGPYGHGRYLGGMRSKGEGSFGSANAAAAMQNEFGLIGYDDARLPIPEIVEDDLGGRWLKYTAETEIDWSYSPEWPIAFDELTATSAAQGFAAQTKCKSVNEVKQAMAQGYGVTIAAGYGEGGKVRPTDGLLISNFTDRMGHQQGLGGYITDDRHGVLFQVDNNWFDMHGRDRILGDLGVTGSYWIREQRLAELLRDPQTEVMAVSTSGDWKTRPIDWSDVFTYED